MIVINEIVENVTITVDEIIDNITVSISELVPINLEVSEVVNVTNIAVEEIVENINITLSETITPVTITIAELGLQGLKGDTGLTGGVISKISGENINSHTPIAIINNLAYKLDSSNPLHQFAFAGFTEASSTIGNLCAIKQIGEVTLSGWGLTPNQNYLAGVNGTLITSNISSLNFTKVIGYATTADTLQIIKDSITINK